jgi:hypothetical protein
MNTQLLGEYYKSDVDLRPGTEVQDMFTATKHTIKEYIRVKVYYREVFELWRYGWIKTDNTLWKIENKNLILLNKTPVTKDELPTYPQPKTPIPNKPQTEPPPEERTHQILKAFLKLNQL